MKPPSQRPERQPGPWDALIVGQLYHPGRRSWPEGADYNFRAGAHELRIFLARATPREIAAIETGRVEWGLMIELPEIFVISRFYGPDSKVRMSFDCSYQWHRVSADERTEPPAWEETKPQLRAIVSIILVEATTGIMLAFRVCSYSAEFTRSFHRAIHDQAALPYDPVAHDQAVADIVRRLTTDQLWARCTIRCEGGA
ncbi:MAG: hypothetical protein ACLP9L_05065 [Thermoguttaceae bacterium]